jgi:hypothetical protein
MKLKASGITKKVHNEFVLEEDVQKEQWLIHNHTVQTDFAAGFFL